MLTRLIILSSIPSEKHTIYLSVIPKDLVALDVLTKVKYRYHFIKR
jgi:hypothetical protein